MGGGAGGIEMPRQTWINEITVTADAGNPGEEEPPEHLPSHRGNSNTADMVTWRVYADGLELPADRRMQGRSRRQSQEQSKGTAESARVSHGPQLEKLRMLKPGAWNPR